MLDLLWERVLGTKGHELKKVNAEMFVEKFLHGLGRPRLLIFQNPLHFILSGHGKTVWPSFLYQRKRRPEVSFRRSHSSTANTGAPANI